MSDPVVDQELWRLAPGTKSARECGCICDCDQTAPLVSVPEFPEPFQPFQVEKDCPLHGLAVMRDVIDRG